jgi:hypothetical protein
MPRQDTQTDDLFTAIREFHEATGEACAVFRVMNGAKDRWLVCHKRSWRTEVHRGKISRYALGS